jgi:hypothetical protein
MLAPAWTMSSTIRDFQSFWHYYLGEHSRPQTKWIHACGTAIGLTAHLLVIPFTLQLRYSAYGFGIGYALAWYSHFTYERNRPATFKHPFWSFFSDLEMFALMVLGWMPRELDKTMGQEPKRPSNRRLFFRLFVRVAVFSYFTLLGLLFYWNFIGW